MKYKGRMVRWAASTKPDAPAGTTPFTFLNDGVPETRPTSMSFELPTAIPKAWEVPDWLRDEITQAVLRAEAAEIERRKRQGEGTDPAGKTVVASYEHVGERPKAGGGEWVWIKARLGEGVIYKEAGK